MRARKLTSSPMELREVLRLHDSSRMSGPNSWLQPEKLWDAGHQIGCDTCGFWSVGCGLQRYFFWARAAQSAILLRPCVPMGFWRADWEECRHFCQAERRTDSRRSPRRSLDPWRAPRGAERPRPTGKFVSRTAAVYRGNGRGGETNLPSELSSKFMDLLS